LSSGETLAGEVRVTPASRAVADNPLDGNSLWLRVEDRSLLERIGKTEWVAVREGEREIARARLPAMAKALPALAACTHQALEKAGIDPAAWTKLRSAPVPTVPLASLFHNSDYPMVSGGSGADVLVRLDVSSSGRTTGCKAIYRSDLVLQRTTCQLLEERARFTPAADATGKPVRSHYVMMVRWRTQ
jgi:hypothetical protein